MTHIKASAALAIVAIEILAGVAILAVAFGI